MNATEARRLNLVNYLVESGQSPQQTVLEKALHLAKTIAGHPQLCMRNDRMSMLKAAYNCSQSDLLRHEFELGQRTLADAGFGKQVEQFVNKSKI